MSGGRGRGKGVSGYSSSFNMAPMSWCGWFHVTIKPRSARAGSTLMTSLSCGLEGADGARVKDVSGQYTPCCEPIVH